jgi:DnaK suppressor protein
MNADLQDARAQLTARLEELQAMSALTKGDRAPVELDQTSIGRLSRVDALQGQAMAHATDARRRDEIKRAEAALRRIDDGEFGYCLKCGEEIGDARLAIDLATPTCIKCAR